MKLWTILGRVTFFFNNNISHAVNRFRHWYSYFSKETEREKLYRKVFRKWCTVYGVWCMVYVVSCEWEVTLYTTGMKKPYKK